MLVHSKHKVCHAAGAILALVFSICAMTIPAFAIGSVPSIIELQVLPGKESGEVIRVYTTAPALRVDVESWGISETGESQSGSINPSEYAWLQTPTLISKKKPKDDFIDVPFKVTLPANTTEEKLAKLAITEQTPTATGLGIALGLGVPVYVSLSGIEKFGVEIAEVTYANDKIRVLILNNGNVHIRPQVEMEISKNGSHFVTQQIANIGLTKDWPILGNSKRWFSKPLTLAPGVYRVAFKVTYGKEFNKNLTQTFLKSVKVK